MLTKVQKSKYKVGSIVKLMNPCLGNKVGTIGVVYENYFNGVSIMFPNGQYDGFSPEEQKYYLKFTGIIDPDMEDYKFLSIIRTSLEFDNGKFDYIFKNKRLCKN